MVIRNKLIAITKVSDPHAHRWGVPCPQCKHSSGPFEEAAVLFFEQGSVECKNCKQLIDLWQACAQMAALPDGGDLTVSCLGATETFFTFDLKRGEHTQIDLTEYGVPESATILELGFTPQGGDCLPLLTHGNNAFVRFVRSKVNLYGMPLGDPAPGGKILARVTWIQGEASAESRLYLVDAMEALAARKYRHSILSAHIAFELEAMSLVRVMLERHASTDRVKKFVEGDLHVSDVVNVILPFISGTNQIPKMPDTIRGALNQLRILRNSIVHRGLPDKPVTEGLACKMLFAAVFGFEYTRFVRQRLFPQVD